jgi:hypothetical protein
VAEGGLVPLDAREREIVSDLISAVRTLAAQVLALHLQLGAVRTLLARKGTISEAELGVALTELDAISSADELLNRSTPSVDDVFEGLLRRLETGD